MACAMCEVARVLLGQAFGALALLADALGVLAVFVPSFIERFRSLTRADPHEPFSMVYPNDRRRRRRSTSPVRAAARVVAVGQG